MTVKATKQQPALDWSPTEESYRDAPLAVQDALREGCPLAYSEQMGWSLFRHRDVMFALERPDIFSNVVSQHASIPNGMDQPEHTAYREMVESYFSPEVLDAFFPTCRHLCVASAEHALEAGELEVMTELALPFAARVQCAFLGWPESLHEALVRWHQANQRAIFAQDRDALRDLAEAFEGLVATQLQERMGPDQAVSGDDLTARLMSEEVQGRRLDSNELASIFRNWTVGEIGTISAAIGILLEFLARHPALQHRLREEEQLLPQAIDEILRLHNPLLSNRRVTRCPVELQGHSLEVGSKIALMWPAANRDPRVFEAPETFRLDRDPGPNLLYGAGIHVCPGAGLARMELQELCKELLRSTTDIALQPEHPPVFATYPATGFASLSLCFGAERPVG